jgi:hypothetical protein
VPLSERLAGLAPPSVELDLRGTVSPSQPELDSFALAQAAQRRKRMAVVALVLAMVGAFSLVFALRRIGGKPTPGEVGRRTPDGQRPDPAVRTIDGALRKYEEPRHPEPPASKPPAPAPPPATEASPAPDKQLAAVEEEDITAYEPPERDAAAFLTILSDMPATVTIDGFRVKKPTPLFKFPVEPGTRRITLESIATQERRTFELSFEKGKLRRVDERFRSPH